MKVEDEGEEEEEEDGEEEEGPGEWGRLRPACRPRVGMKAPVGYPGPEGMNILESGREGHAGRGGAGRCSQEHWRAA